VSADNPQGHPEGEPVIRDKRRIDPTTGAVRPDVPSAAGAQVPGGGVSDAATGSASFTSGPAVPPSAPVGGPHDGAAEAELAERTADLQRVQAEYANYRKRVERDRESVRELAVIGVLSGLLPVLDDIGRARDHGELVGGFKVVAESLEATLTKLGLQPFGVDGDPFDPNVHEALMHEYSSDVSEPTCVAILQPGYRVGERVVRPARVKVAEPGEPNQEN
jgi:molecular chaperone GrpE